MPSDDTLTIGQIARKPVISLPIQASIAESIRLMYRERIRHIPIMENTIVQGVVNPECIIDLIAFKGVQVDFNRDVRDMISNNFKVVSPDFPLFEAVELVSQDPSLVILLEETETIVGIFTEIDILDTDFLWLNLNDHPISATDTFGKEIQFNYTTSPDNSIHDTLKLMEVTDTNYFTLTEGDTVRGIVDIFGIIHHLYYANFRQGRPLAEVLQDPMHVIFPSSGAWYTSPVLLSQVRREFYINDIYFGIVMDNKNHARRVISSRDITQYLVNNSDYFDTAAT